MKKASRQGLTKLTTSKERIKRFLVEQDISLTSEEVSLLQRWEFADKLMMGGITVTAILRQRIQDEFHVSISTADNDIWAAHEIFGESRKINKRYLGHLHLNDIHADLTRLRKKLFEDKKVPDHREAQALAKLHDAYTYQLNSLPDKEQAPIVKRPIWIFGLVKGDEVKPPMMLEEALRIADSEFIIPEILPNGKTDLENGAAKD